MAGTPTTNYSLPTFASTDPPDLLTVYNEAMTIIDTQLKALSDSISSGVNTTPATSFSVADLAASGVTSEGLVVNSTPSEV